MAATQTVNDSAGKTITAFGVSYAITSLFNVLLVLVKENIPGIQPAMVSLTGHHWVTHGVIDVIVFVILGLVLKNTAAARMPADKLVNYVVGSTILSGLILVGYFTVA
jgi:uncharacterized Tic20 family protein